MASIVGRCDRSHRGPHRHHPPPLRISHIRPDDIEQLCAERLSLIERIADYDHALARIALVDRDDREALAQPAIDRMEKCVKRLPQSLALDTRHERNASRASLSPNEMPSRKTSSSLIAMISSLSLVSSSMSAMNSLALPRHARRSGTLSIVLLLYLSIWINDEDTLSTLTRISHAPPRSASAYLFHS